MSRLSTLIIRSLLALFILFSLILVASPVVRAEARMNAPETAFDIEPPSVTYVDDDWASDVPAADPDGAGPAIAFGVDAFAKIQDAIDAVAPGGTVNVYPGSYNETAAGRRLFDGSGPYQFGLFAGSDKAGISVRGVDAAGAPIVDQHNVQAGITTNATNSFGYSGIFVEADGVTFSGLKILQNLPSDNKSVEVIGDNFSLLDSVIDVPGGGSVYLNDWSFAGGVSHLKAYRIEGSRFAQAASLDIASGAGYSGPDSGRVVKNNVFEYDPSAYWPAISFTGTVPSVGWFVNPVSGAQITGNTFSGGVQYIRARGTYNEASFDWASYWNNNTFDRAVVVGTALPASPRAFSYTSGSYTFNNVRRIGALIQGEIDNAQPGDTVLVKAGAYAESPHINKSISLRSESGRDQTTIALQHTPTYLGSLTISGADVTLDGFTITGFDATASALASSNIFLTTTPHKVSILNNRLKVGNIGANSNGDDGFGLITSYAETSDVSELLVQGNLFEPLNAVGWRAFYINPGVNQFTFRQNSITGSFGGRATTQAKNGLVEENTLTGSGTSGGFATWGYPTPSIYGKTTFRNNLITGTQKGISITSTENVTVSNNELRDNAMGVWVGNSADMPLAFNAASVQVHNNSITGSTEFALKNEETGTVNATQNWWGSARGPKASGNPLGDGGEISGAAAYDPWLCDGTDTNPGLLGFQPGSLQCTSQPVRLVFTTQPSDGIAGIALPAQPVVRVEGVNGELAVNFDEAITLLLANNPGGAVLSGQISLNAVDGIAAFSGLSLDKPANGYSLLAWASVGVKAGAAFNILPFEADLAVSHTAIPAVVAPNATWSITLGVANAGPAEAANLSLTDTLPAGAGFVSAVGPSWSCSEALGVVHCTLPSLLAGASTSVTITLKAPSAPGLLTNQAVVSSDVPDLAAANNTSSAATTVVAVPVTGGLTYYLPSVSH